MEHILLSKLISKSIELGRIRERLDTFIHSTDKSNENAYKQLELQDNQLYIEIEVLKQIMIEAYWNNQN